MYEAPEAPLTPTEPAPGTKGAFHCGLWSVLLNVMCGCFPVAIPLGIAAIIKHGKAERAAQAEPGRYVPPPNTGKVLGIVGLCLTLFAFAWMGIVSAIAIPALLGQRDRAKAIVVKAHVAQAAAEVARVADDLRLREGHAATPDQVVAEVLASPEMKAMAARNPYLPGLPAFRMGGAATEDGEVVLDPEPAYQDPQTGQTFPAVLIHGRYRAGGQSQTLDKVVALD